MTALTEEIEILVHAIVDAYKRQSNVQLNYNQFIHEFEINQKNNLSIVLNTTRTDDHLKIKCYIRAGNATTIEKFQLMEMANYGPGYEDEIFISTLSYDQRTLPEFHKFVTNTLIKYQNASDDLGVVISEDGAILLTENNGIVTVD